MRLSGLCRAGYCGRVLWRPREHLLVDWRFTSELPRAGKHWRSGASWWDMQRAGGALTTGVCDLGDKKHLFFGLFLEFGLDRSLVTVRIGRLLLVSSAVLGRGSSLGFTIPGGRCGGMLWTATLSFSSPAVTILSLSFLDPTTQLEPPGHLAAVGWPLDWYCPKLHAGLPALLTWFLQAAWSWLALEIGLAMLARLATLAQLATWAGQATLA